MLCVEDQIDTLKWAESVGGLKGLIRRSEENLATIAAWVEKTSWVKFLAEDPATRSSTSVCLSLDKPKEIAAKLEAEGVAYDITSHRDAPSGLRIWAGSTVEKSDIEALLPWLDWAWNEVK
jgi:phosphoserine aminotransferase